MIKSESLTFTFLFYWSIVDYNVVLISTVQENDSVLYIYIHTHTHMYRHTHIHICRYVMYIYILFHILFHYGFSRDIDYSSLCCTVGPCCLWISHLYIQATSLPPQGRPLVPVHVFIQRCSAISKGFVCMSVDTSLVVNHILQHPVHTPWYYTLFFSLNIS